jgi:hypothetical protein
MSEREFIFKSTVDGQEVNLKVLAENLKIQQKADQQYHIAYVQAIKEGIPPRSTLEKMLRDNEMWTAEDDIKLDSLRLQTATLELQLDNVKTKQEGLTIAVQLSEIRGQLVDIQRVRNEVLNNSADYVAEAIRRDAFLAYATVYADTGKPVFENYTDFINRSEEQIVTDLRREVTTAMLKDFNNYLDTLPEAKFVDIDKEQEVPVSTRTKKKTKKKTIKKNTKKKAMTKKRG